MEMGLISTAHATVNAAQAEAGTLTFWILGALLAVLLLVANLLAMTMRGSFGRLEKKMDEALVAIRADLREGSRRFQGVDRVIAGHAARLSVIERTCELQHGPMPRRSTDPPGYDGMSDRCHGGERQE